MMLLVAASVGVLVMVHAALRRATVVPASLAFLLAVALVAGAMAAGMILLRPSAEYAIGATLAFIFAAELYLFAFTFASASVSSNLLMLLPASTASVETSYRGADMAALRVQRARRAGLIARDRDMRFGLTRRGRWMDSIFSTLRNLAGHDAANGSLWNLVWFVVAAAVLLLPIVDVARQHATLTGMFEESIGYRYFYSLRSIYEPGSRLFLPQGQLIDIYHQIIHRILTALGYSPLQLFPRIDYFTYGSVIGMELFNALAFAWMIVGLRRATSRILVAIAWLWLICSPQFSFCYGLLQPDYPAIEPGLAMLAAGAMMRTLDGTGLTLSRSLGFGAFLACAASTKVTLTALPLIALGHAVLSAPHSRAVIGRTIGAIAIGIIGAIVLAKIQLHTSWSGLADYGFNLWNFMRTGGGDVARQTLRWPVWLIKRMGETPFPTWAIYAAPLVALPLTLLPRSRGWLVALMLLEFYLIGENAFLYARDYAMTLMEAALPVMVLATLALKHAERWRVTGTVIVGLSILLLPSLRYDVPFDLIRYTILNSEGQKKLPTATGPEKQLWLVRDNSLRPLSVHTAIMKGGDYGMSPLVRMIAPNLSFRFYHYNPGPFEVRDFDGIYFGFSDDIEAERDKVASYYAVDLSGLRCRPIEDGALRVAECINP